MKQSVARLGHIFWVFLSIFWASTTNAYCYGIIGELGSDRVAAIENWRNDDKRLIGSISRLSPSEQAWLDGEVFSDSAERRQAVLDSVEYAVSRTIHYFTWRAEMLDRILENELPGSLAPRKALARYSLLAGLMFETDSISQWVIRLSDAGRIGQVNLSEVSQEARKEIYQMACRANARAILNSVLTPALETLKE